MQPAAAPVVVQLVSHGFVVTLIQESDIQKRIEQIKSATHRDILQVNVIGNYFDLTRKVTAASTRTTAVARGPISSYDDVYANVHNLMAAFWTRLRSKFLLSI
ncbi:hypothetical protein DAPPUDRAFT_264833 [Daphnia pulex]|uniref:Uncharacterized protein n=1 Tax=Daphnia pulex TaxID=6669 RepID=E9HSE8_DAPPU|nr:hypothetical protein DAPPUDRAFT_264833 [Daphnia pulex]|eukprot:EFX65331.1 hypothetical protein DAPPUDRAFT_264833 [Daphnia pulex]